MGNDGRDTELPETGDICRCVMVVDWTITAYSVALIARALAMIPPHAVRAGVAQRIFHWHTFGGFLSLVSYKQTWVRTERLRRTLMHPFHYRLKVSSPEDSDSLLNQSPNHEILKSLPSPSSA